MSATTRRIWATAGICLSLIPLWAVWLVEWWYLRIRDGEAPHRPKLSPAGGELGELVSAPPRVA